VCVCVCVNECVYVSSEGRGQGEERGMQEVYRWAKDRAAKGVSFQMLGTRTWVFFEGSGNVLGTRRSDGSSTPGMSCGDDVAEASMRDRG